MISTAFSGLNISTALASPGDSNFIPDSWPPSPDFPICLSSKGEVLARYGENIWDLSEWAGYVLKLRFSSSNRKDSPFISPANTEIFKQVVAYWLYGPKAIREPRTLHIQYEIIKPIFTHCSKQGIDETALHRYPSVIESLSKEVWPSQANTFIHLLHNLWSQREYSGLFILDPDGIAILTAMIPEHIKSQTAYIPPRIWLYQVGKLKEFLEDFEAHIQDLKSCSEFCLQAYADNAGGIMSACSDEIPEHHKPFSMKFKPGITKHGKNAIFLGPFYKTADRFNILTLLEKWCGNVHRFGILTLSAYFSMASQVGKAYLLNFSLMRTDEASSLRTNCLLVEKDVITNEDIYLLKGATSKTVDDPEAYWITAPQTALAVRVMSFVSAFRTKCAKNIKQLTLSDENSENPYLILRPYEPWGNRSAKSYEPDTRSQAITYKSFMRKFSTLFDKNSLRITEKDLSDALLVTPTLSPSKYSVGEIWPLGWHQLRRTGAVNMNASGIVSEPSLQYQLKHLTRMMTRYYGNGSYHLDYNLDQEAKAEYVRAMYESVARSFSSFASDNFVSPHGGKRKEQLISIVNVRDHQKLVKAAQSGSIVYREIMLGACANTVPCPFGGIDYVGRCGGGDGSPACLDLLIDKQKKSQIQKLAQVLSFRLSNAVKEEPLYTSIRYQLKAVENALYAIENS